MAFSIIQNTFTLGEMDPKLLARVDFEGYYKTARKLRNCVVIPQGGTKRRFGTTYTDTITDKDNPFGTVYFSDSTYILICDFLFTLDKIFTIVIRPTLPSVPIQPTDAVAIDVYLNDVFQVTVAGSPTYNVGQIPNINFVRAPDRLLLLHEDVRPQMLQRAGADNVWTLTPQPFEFYPTFDFTVIDNAAGYGGITFTPSATTGAITLTASAPIFTSNHVGGLFDAFDSNTGTMRITAVASTTSASGFSVKDFTNTNAIRGDRAYLAEPLYGDGGGGVGVNPARGWPTVGGFFQGRLIYGAPKSVPNIISFSTIRDFENFDDSEAEDTNGFSYVMTSEGYQKVTAIIGTKALVIITNASVFTTNALADSPITPGTVFFNEQTREGMAPLTAQVLDDQVLFVENNRRAVKSFVYDIIQSSFQAESASILSPHLINGPVESATYVNPLEDDGSFYMLVNEDGTLAVFQTDKNQLVRAWTLSSTQGFFRDITSVKEVCHVLVERGAADPTAMTTPESIFRVTAPFNYFEDIRPDIIAGNPEVIFVEDNDYLVIGHSSPYFAMNVTLAVGPNFIPAVEYEYLNFNGDWQDFFPTDGTNGFVNSGTITWTATDVSEWRPLSVNETDRKFWIRIKRTTNDSDIDAPPQLAGLTIQIQQRMYLEKITFAEVMDAVRTATTDADGNITGLTSIVGQQVYVTVQDVPHGPYFVDAAGEIHMGEDLDYGNLDVKIGFDYTPLVIPAPPTMPTQQGVNVYYPKLIQAMFLDYVESAGLFCRGQEIPRMAINNAAVDVRLIPETDIFEIPTMAGRDPRVQIEITQYQPLPFTLIGIGYKVTL